MKSEKTFLIYFKFPIGQLDGDKAFDVLMEFEDILREIVESENLGNVDGHEFCYGEAEESITFFIYTTDEEKLFKLIEPLLVYIPCLPCSYVLKDADKEQYIFI